MWSLMHGPIIPWRWIELHDNRLLQTTKSWQIVYLVCVQPIFTMVGQYCDWSSHILATSVGHHVASFQGHVSLVPHSMGTRLDVCSIPCNVEEVFVAMSVWKCFTKLQNHTKKCCNCQRFWPLSAILFGRIWERDIHVSLPLATNHGGSEVMSPYAQVYNNYNVGG